MPRPVATALALWVLAVSGCGGRFPLPTEVRSKPAPPTDKTYAMLATWSVPNVRDLLITQGTGSVFFVLRNTLPSETTPVLAPSPAHGDVQQYFFTRPQAVDPTYFRPLTSLINPIALASARGSLFVLDRGDSCTAKFDTTRATCEADRDTTHATGHPHRSQIYDYRMVWRVREYDLSGGDTLSTFTDTTVAQVYGLAADQGGNVYVSCLAVVVDTSSTNSNIRTRKFASRVYRYARGPQYPGITLPFDYMPGSSDRWHRDTTWLVLSGTGLSSVQEPRGIYWSQAGRHPLIVADRGNNMVKAIDVTQMRLAHADMDGSTTGYNFDNPFSVAGDLQEYIYVVDRNNQRVLRYDAAGNYIQRVDIQPNASGLGLLDPVSVAVDDTLAYVADRGRGEIVRYRRRP